MNTTNKNIRRTVLFLFAVIVLNACGKKESTPDPVIPPVTPPAAKTFVNPLLSGSDPWVVQKDSFYYYMHTLGNRVAIWKTKNMSKLGTATITTIFSAAPGTPNSSNVWAPEMHWIDGKWYVYYTAGSGADSTQRLWVLENSNADPTTGTWVDKGKIAVTDADFWSIDGSMFEANGNKYFIWSGRPNAAIQNQNIYIAKMSNPWTLESPAVMLSKPELGWELNGGPVNEGPEILKNSNGKTFLIYSASGCWTDDYALGQLTLADGTDPLVASNWTKASQPVFVKQPQNKAYGPGHNAFFKSPDGTEDWIIYHANNNTGEGCGVARNIRIQKFTWNTNGTPNFGTAVKTLTALPVPAGE